MPQKSIKFTGINRRVNEFQAFGACEELINLRPTASGVEVVKTKITKFNNPDYDIYNHVFADKSLFIGITPGQTFYLYLISENGTKTTIDEFTGDGTEYSVAFIGNQMILSQGQYLRAYAYKDGEYVVIDADVPNDLDITYSISTGSGYSNVVSVTSSDPQSNEFKNVITENWSAAMGNSSDVSEAFGPIMVAFNFSLSDGTEFWTNKWIYVNPFLYLPQGEDGRKMVYYENGSTKTVTFNSYTPRFTISQLNSELIEHSMVSSVNVYASRPIFPYDIDSMASGSSVHERAIFANARGMKELEIADELLYFQKSIPISQLENGSVTFTLDFGPSQAGERVLEVDSGPVTRAGEIVAYNNRLHVFNSYATIVPQSVVCLSNVSSSFYERDAYVYIESGTETIILKTSALVPIPSGSSIVHEIYCCYPDARAKKILIKYNDTSYSTINLRQSDRYNYAWGEAEFPDNLVNTVTTTSPVIYESNTINVSHQFNPFVFPVEYSYSVGGEILDVATSYLPISSTQIGQYPLTVFTTSGIYAMEQGSGGALYGNIIPIQPMVIDSKAAPTPMGTFFVSSHCLYILSGRDAVNVSQILNGELEMPLRENDSYKALVLDDSSDFQDFSEILSSVEFEQFVSGADLVYDQFRNELFVSREGYKYSYVFNLDTKSFHKVSRRYVQGASSARYVVEQTGARMRVVDLLNENSEYTSILLQSRPFSLETAFTHIQRMVLYVDANMSGSQGLFLTVFASDNLYDWNCIISSQKANVALRQIRTNKAAKSYRDYIVMINGTVVTDVDISDLIADYTVVNRRLG